MRTHVDLGVLYLQQALRHVALIVDLPQYYLWSRSSYIAVGWLDPHIAQELTLDLGVVIEELAEQLGRHFAYDGIAIVKVGDDLEDIRAREVGVDFQLVATVVGDVAGC